MRGDIFRDALKGRWWGEHVDGEEIEKRHRISGIGVIACEFACRINQEEDDHHGNG